MFLFLSVLHIAVIVLQLLVLRQPVKDKLRIKVIPVTQAAANANGDVNNGNVSEENGLVASDNTPRIDTDLF